MYEDYTPTPVDTSGVVLSEDIVRLIRRLAENQHELRCRAYLEAGWVFGDQRDSYRRTHPGLMPYRELTEEMKRNDLLTGESLVKTIYALGYRIVE